MTTKAETDRQGVSHSYEKFTQRPVYREVNRMTILLAPQVRYAVDIATGTGEMIQQMLEQRKLLPGFQARGYDIDGGALEEAREKFKNLDRQIAFGCAPAELIPLPDEWAQLVTFCNAIHLTKAQSSLDEAGRILVPSGTILINTAYERGQAYPDERSRRSFGNLVGMGRRIATKDYGITDIPEPEDLLKYSLEDFERMLSNAGFGKIESYPTIALMDIDDVKAICHYDEFVKGALPGVDLEIAKKALDQAGESMFRRSGMDTISRGWQIIKAIKLPKAA